MDTLGENTRDRLWEIALLADRGDGEGKTVLVSGSKGAAPREVPLW